MPPKPAFPEPAAALPGEADILAAVVADLSDDTAKLVYADWLGERDDPRGDLLRKSVAAFRAGKKLPSTKGFPQPWLDLVGITLMERIRRAELTAHADAFLRLARPAVSLKSAKAAEAKLPIGASKLGGGADLPPGVEWPTFDEEPLAFLAQLNLAELSASFVCRELPDSGVLSVFYLVDDEDERDSDPKGTFRVFHFPDVSKLTRHPPPETAFRSCRLEFRETLGVPGEDSPWRKELGLGRKEDLWDAYQERVVGFDTGHGLLGYPIPIQNDVLGKKTVRHLMTIDSDDNPDWMWGDGGALYFVIGEEDLKAKRFDRVRCEMQCG